MWEFSTTSLVDGEATVTLPGEPGGTSSFLVAVVAYFHNGDEPAINWETSEVALNQQVGFTRTIVHAMQGDGETKSVTFTLPTAEGGQVTLARFSGFVSTTPSQVVSDVSTQGARVDTDIPPDIVATVTDVPAIALSVVPLQNFVTSSSIAGEEWTNLTPHFSGFRAFVAVASVTTAGDTPPIITSWWPTRTFRRNILVWEGTPPPADDGPEPRHRIGGSLVQRRIGPYQLN